MKIKLDVNHSKQSVQYFFGVAFVLLCVSVNLPTAYAGKIQIHITGEDSSQLPCRIHLTDAKEKSHRPTHLPFWRDHFVCDGKAELDLPEGEYKLEIERGPEYERFVAALTVDQDSPSRVSVQLKRIADLASQGWYSGDLHVHRPVEDVELLMRAEDLNIAPVNTWWNDRNLWKGKELPDKKRIHFERNRFYDVLAGEDEREGGALLYFHLDKPLSITGSTKEYPSPMKFVAEARKHSGTWIDIEKPFWWDAPVWLASGEADSIGLANNHMCRSRMYEDEAWGRSRDSKALPAPRGNGFWTQNIYYHILNTGLRIPTSAGSASGVLPNPVGYNRVYVNVNGELTWKKWWAGLKAGRSFVTNGPLLRCKANGHLPGYIFKSDGGKELTISIDASLISNDEVPFLEVIQNGKIVQKIPAHDLKKTGSKFQAKVTFEKSGWFLVRAITSEQRTFRFASTAPWYVEIENDQKRISKSSVQFFLTWINERIERVRKNVEDPNKRQEVLKHHLNAREFWEELLKKANAD